MTNITAAPGQITQSAPLPVASLLALALAGFITILTETLPAGLLPQISAGMNISGAMAGQFVTLYAVGSLVAAIPLITATQGARRRPLLLLALAGFSLNYVMTMIARFMAGVSAGLVWALLAGYAARMVPVEQKGRAIAIAMVGTPLALSLGVPAGTFLGGLVGWRMCFGIISVMAITLMVWVRFLALLRCWASGLSAYSLTDVCVPWRSSARHYSLCLRWYCGSWVISPLLSTRQSLSGGFPLVAQQRYSRPPLPGPLATLLTWHSQCWSRPGIWRLPVADFSGAYCWDR